MDKGHLIATATIIFVLLKMRKELGLEKMLEYMEIYQNRITEDKPEMIKAIRHTLGHLDLEKILKGVDRAI